MIVNIIALIIIVVILIFGSIALIGAPYVPSKGADVEHAFSKLYPLNENDLLIDFGAGDGHILKYATSHGASAIGVEINPLMVLIARINLRHTPATVVCANYLNFTFPEKTTVVYTFGDSRDIYKIYQKIKHEATRLDRPLYFISYAFNIHGVKPIKKSGPFFLYKVFPLSISPDSEAKIP